MAQLRCTIKKKDGEYTVRITDVITNKLISSYETNDKLDAHSTAEHIVRECESRGDTFVKKP